MKAGTAATARQHAQKTTTATTETAKSSVTKDSALQNALSTKSAKVTAVFAMREINVPYLP